MFSEADFRLEVTLPPGTAIGHVSLAFLGTLACFDMLGSFVSQKVAGSCHLHDCRCFCRGRLQITPETGHQNHKGGDEVMGVNVLIGVTAASAQGRTPRRNHTKGR